MFVLAVSSAESERPCLFVRGVQCPDDRGGVDLPLAGRGRAILGAKSTFKVWDESLTGQLFTVFLDLSREFRLALGVPDEAVDLAAAPTGSMALPNEFLKPLLRPEEPRGMSGRHRCNAKSEYICYFLCTS